MEQEIYIEQLIKFKKMRLKDYINDLKNIADVLEKDNENIQINAIRSISDNICSLNDELRVLKDILNVYSHKKD